MKIFQQLKYVLVAIFASATMALVGSSAVSAADVPEYRLQVSPAREDIGDLKPGESYTGTFKVQNTG